MARATHLSLQAGFSYETKLRIAAGMAAGFISSLSIMAVVTLILLATGNDIWTAARLIASSVYGTQAESGWMPIAAGTLLHLVTGTFFGAIFARLVPRMPANIYVVAGLIYGLLTFSISAFLILPVVAPLLVATKINLSVLLLAHIIYGFVLGVAGGYIELLWNLPKPSAR